MRAETRKLEQAGLRLTVDQDEIGANVAITKAMPGASKSVISEAFRKWLVRS